ncbi:hypothetical protein LCGC14_2196860 [marine sediment metagenome]|uniref:Uncharacterized protein n=1 Tax=marine sediment metagenome TaxID=412755 RepID=A0A0F9DHZ2_9ZZZZ
MSDELKKAARILDNESQRLINYASEPQYAHGAGTLIREAAILRCVSKALKGEEEPYVELEVFGV